MVHFPSWIILCRRNAYARHRPAHDRYTTPGSYTIASQRLLDDELAGSATTGQPCYVQIVLEQTRLEMNNSRIFYVEVAGGPEIGTFYDVEYLPPDALNEQITFIRVSARAFRSAKP